MQSPIQLRCFFISITTLFLLQIQIHAEEAQHRDEQSSNTESDAAKKNERTYMSIGEIETIVVTSDRFASRDLPGSIDVIGEQQIQLEITDNALDLMRRVPGFVFHDYGNGGVPNGFMMRGFASNHGSDTLVTIDGIPINDHLWQEDGAPDLNQLTAEEIELIEVVKGPIDARFGNWARSGIINIETRRRGDYLKAKLTKGSWNHYKGYVSFGSEHFNRKFNQIYSVEYYTNEAWRENSARERKNAYAKWFYRPDSENNIGLMAHLYKANWATGAYINEEQWKEDPRQAFSGAQNDGGYKSLIEISALADGNLFSILPYKTRVWFRDSQASRYADWTTEGNHQTEIHGKEKVIGMLLHTGYEWDLSYEHNLKFEAGTDYRHFETHLENWNTKSRSRMTINFNNDYNFQNAGLFIKARHAWLDAVETFVGIRQDLFLGDTYDHLEAEGNEMQNIGVTTYKGGLLLTLLSDLMVYGNIGTTFHLPKAELKFKIDPPATTSLVFWEIGLKTTPLDWMNLRYSYFRGQEEILREEQSEFIDDGQALREGHEIEIVLSPMIGLEVFFAYTHHTTRYDGGKYDRLWVPAVPRYIFKLGIQVELPHGTGGRLDFNKIGKWNTDAENQYSYPGYQTLDLTVYQHLYEQWSVQLDVHNLLNENYAEYVGYWGGSNQYMSSNPRTFFVSIRYHQI